MKPQSLVPYLLIPILFCACSKSEQETSPTQPSAEVNPIETLKNLLGTNWKLIELDGAATPADSRAGISFPEDGRVAGNAAVNRFTGAIQQVDGKWKIGPLAVTRMAGPPEAMELEGKFLKVMDTVDQIKADETSLSLISSDPAISLRFEKQESDAE